MPSEDPKGDGETDGKASETEEPSGEAVHQELRLCEELRSRANARSERMAAIEGVVCESHFGKKSKARIIGDRLLKKGFSVEIYKHKKKLFEVEAFSKVSGRKQKKVRSAKSPPEEIASHAGVLAKNTAICAYGLSESYRSFPNGTTVVVTMGSEIEFNETVREIYDAIEKQLPDYVGALSGVARISPMDLVAIADSLGYEIDKDSAINMMEGIAHKDERCLFVEIDDGEEKRSLLVNVGAGKPKMIPINDGDADE